MKPRGNSQQGVLFVLSAPSGCGKTTVSEQLICAVPGLKRSISMTTRPPRANEVSGEDYLFVSEDEFVKRRKRGELLEWAMNFGALYGTPKARVEEALRCGADVLLTIDVKGARQIKKKKPRSIHIFLMPPSAAELERRLRKRATDTSEDIKYRLTIAQREMARSKEYDYVVVNDSVNDAVARLKSIVQRESKKNSTKRGSGGR